MILRLVELDIQGTPMESMERFLEASLAPPLPHTVVLPELYTTGYVLDRIKDLALSPDELAGLPPAGAARENGVWIVAGTLPVDTGSGVVNMMAVYDPHGNMAYTTEKVHLFSQMGEDRAFVPGSCGGIFDYCSTLAGGVICYDLRFPELSRRLALSGAEILFVPAQWPSGRRELFRSLLRARSAEAQIFTAGCNLGGEHLGVLFDGGGGVAHPGGKMVRGMDVSEGVRDFEIDLEDVAAMREKINCLEDRRPEEYGLLLEWRRRNG
jgi:predicted amidohydrolase